MSAGNVYNKAKKTLTMNLFNADLNIRIARYYSDGLPGGGTT